MPKPPSPYVKTGPGQGAGRPGPPGPPGAGFAAGLDLTGTSQEQAVIGFRTVPLSTDAPADGDAYIYDSGTGTWVPQQAGGGGGTVAPLSRAVFVDGGTSTPSIDQDGSIGKPFSTLQAAFDAIQSPSQSNWAIFVTPGDYDESGLTLNSNGKNTSIVSPGYGQVNINLSTYGDMRWLTAGRTTLTLRNVSMATISMSSGGSDSPDVCELYLDNTSSTGVTGQDHEMDVFLTGPASYVQELTTTGTFFAEGARFVANVEAESIELKTTFIQGFLLSDVGNISLKDCEFDPGSSVHFGGYLQQLYLDSSTYYWVQELGISITGSSFSINFVSLGRVLEPRDYDADEDGHTMSPVLTDMGKCISVFSASVPVSVKIPKSTTTPYPVGCFLYFLQINENPSYLTVSGVTGVTVFSLGSKFQSAGSGALVWAWQRSKDEWLVGGDLV